MLAAVTLAACSSSSRLSVAPVATTAPVTSTTSAVGPTATTAPPTTVAATSPPAAGPSSVQLADDANGTTATVAVGASVTVVLHSTYWAIDAPPGPVLVATGPATPGPGKGCGPTIPGSGCGTVTLVLRAAAVGTAVLTASRTSCGEAMRCSAEQSAWKVTVRVTA